MAPPARHQSLREYLSEYIGVDPENIVINPDGSATVDPTGATHPDFMSDDEESQVYVMPGHYGIADEDSDEDSEEASPNGEEYFYHERDEEFDISALTAALGIGRNFNMGEFAHTSAPSSDTVASTTTKSEAKRNRNKRKKLKKKLKKQQRNQDSSTPSVHDSIAEKKSNNLSSVDGKELNYTAIVKDAVDTVNDIQDTVGSRLIFDVTSMVDDMFESIYDDSISERVVKPIIKSVHKVLKASNKKETANFYQSATRSVDISSMTKDTLHDFVIRRYDHILNGKPRYVSMDSQYIPYFTNIKNQCASFITFRLKDGTEANILNKLFKDKDNLSQQGLFTLKTRIEQLGIQKLLVNTCTSEQLKGNFSNPLFGKNSKRQDVDAKLPLYAGNITCLLSFIYSVTCQYMQYISKAIDMGPHNSEDCMTSYSLGEEEIYMMMAQASVGLDPFSRKTPAVLKKAIRVFKELSTSPMLRAFYTPVVTASIPPYSNDDWFSKYYILKSVYEHGEGLLQFSKNATESPIVCLRNPFEQKDIDMARIIAKGILPFAELVRQLSSREGSGSFAYISILMHIKNIMEELSKDTYILECGIDISRIIQRINNVIESTANQAPVLFVAGALHRTEGYNVIREYQQIKGKDIDVLKEFSLLAGRLGAFDYVTPLKKDVEDPNQDMFLAFLDNSLTEAECKERANKCKKDIASYTHSTLKKEFLNYRKYILSNYEKVLTDILTDRKVIREFKGGKEIFFRRREAKKEIFGPPSKDNDTEVGQTELLTIQNLTNCKLIAAYIDENKAGKQKDKILPCILQYLRALQIANANMSNIFYYSVREFDGWDDPLEYVEEKAFLRSVMSSFPRNSETRISDILTQNCIGFVNAL